MAVKDSGALEVMACETELCSLGYDAVPDVLVD